MTAAATTMTTSSEGVAARRATRDARLRGVAFAVLGLLAF